MTIIDASVYISLVNAHEERHVSSWVWFQSAASRKEGIYAPVILLAEVAAALSHGVGDVELAHRIVEQLR